MNLLDKKVIFITGGTSGIGKATVFESLKQGAKVGFCGRSEEKGKEILETAEKLNFSENIFFQVCDVTNFDQVKSVVEKTVEKFGKLDGVFANAGIHKIGNILETSVEIWKQVFDINLNGIFYTLKSTIPYLHKNSGGNIVLMGSDQSLVGKENSSAYGATKGAIGQLTKSTAIDFAKNNIRVNAVCPGTIDTPLARKAAENFAKESFGGDFGRAWSAFEKAQPIQNLGKSEDVANLVTYLLSDKSKFMTGGLISIDGGYVAG